MADEDKLLLDDLYFFLTLGKEYMMTFVHVQRIFYCKCMMISCLYSQLCTSSEGQSYSKKMFYKDKEENVIPPAKAHQRLTNTHADDVSTKKISLT